MRLNFSSREFDMQMICRSINIPLKPAPLDPSTIVAGAPVATNADISSGLDKRRTSWVWECTPGVFDWDYTTEESFFILEGSATLDDGCGNVVKIGPGDLIVAPEGAKIRWSIEMKIRKVAFFAPRKRNLRNIVASIRRRLGLAESAPRAMRKFSGVVKVA